MARKIEPEQIIEEKEVPQEEAKKIVEKAQEKIEKKKIPESKFKIGDIVFIKKDAEADLNGFKLFPQYKKYTYTVEAYDKSSDVYTLRRLNLSLKLKGELLVAPEERAHDSLNRKQY